MLRHFQQPGTAILWLACGLAACVAAGGLLASRRTERIVERPPGNRIDDLFRQTAFRIGRLEEQWKEALDAEAVKSLGESRIAPADNQRAPEVIGATRRYFLNPSRNDANVSSGEMIPILNRFARNQSSEWSFDDTVVQSSGEFIEAPGKPPVFSKGDGRRAVILVLDPSKALPVVAADVSKSPDVASLDGEPGQFQWRGPGDSIISATSSRPSARPDEILRHVSVFGNWELRRWYPVKTSVTYHTPTVAGASAISTLLVIAGVSASASQRRAIRLAEERVSFVNRVSHELRSPLTNLLLNTDLAIDHLPQSEEKVRGRLFLIREETARLARMVDNVLAFAKMERGDSHVHPSSCDLSRILSEVSENFEPLFARKQIRCEIDHSLPHQVVIDGDAFQQILSNLFSNVEKYAGDNATVKISARVRDQVLALELSDDGPGIPVVHQSRIFKPFERLAESTTEGVSGAGLGLAISRDLATRMGGSLDLLPGPGGACFRFTLPLSGTHSLP